MKKLVSIAAGVGSGLVLSLIYLMVSYIAGNSIIPSGVEYYSLANIALAGFLIVIAITIATFISLHKKWFSFALSFLISSTLFGLISFVILSSIKYYF